MTHRLPTLEFDVSDDECGHLAFDALACVTGQHLGAVLDDMARVLAWAHARAQWRCAPDEDGGDWSYALMAQHEPGLLLAPRFDAATGTIMGVGPHPAGPGSRTTLALTLCGHAAFGHALQEAFAIG